MLQCRPAALHLDTVRSAIRYCHRDFTIATCAEPCVSCAEACVSCDFAIATCAEQGVSCDEVSSEAGIVPTGRTPQRMAGGNRRYLATTG